MELLRNKDEYILVNTLKLVMTLISQSGSESNNGRQIADANENEIILMLI